MRETGEAAPEISKLPLLARTFSVTADWLLDDEAGFDEESSPDDPAGAPLDRPSPDTVPSAPAYPEWVDHLPGFLSNMLKKYGWIFGVRTAVSGALFTVMGFVARAIFASMGNMINMDMPGISGGVTFYDEAGNVVDPSHFGLTSADLSAMGMSSSYGFSNFSFSGGLPEPFDIFCSFIIGIGLVLLIGGGLLAWYLKKKGQENL